MSDFEFRRVQPQDVAFCWTIYREAMQPLTAELMQWNEDAQRRGIEATLGDDDASILISDDTDAGCCTSSRRAATSISAISISRRRRATMGSAPSSCAGWASAPGARTRTSPSMC